MEIRDKVVIVTGASAGIGEATARLAAREGAHVVLAARRLERIEVLAEELGGLAVRTDMRNPADVAQLASAALGRYDRIDVLINNAAQGLDSSIADMRVEDLIAIFELNVFGPVIAMQAVLPAMRRQGAGAIVNISSDITGMVVPFTAAYAASKVSLNMFSAVARAELADDGIVVSTVLPTLTATDFPANALGGLDESPSESWPVEPQTPEEVGEAILELVRTGEATVDLAQRAKARERDGARSTT